MVATGDALKVETPYLVLMKAPQEQLSIWAQLRMQLELGTPGTRLVTRYLIIAFLCITVCNITT